MAQTSDVPFRRRGRPSGKNRIPLSLDERRARNAQYERERRYETSEAISELAEAAGCDPSFNNADILATVISQLQRAATRDPSDDIEEMKRFNEKLMLQVESLEKRLNDLEESRSSKQEESNDANNIKRRGENLIKPSKRIKSNENLSDLSPMSPSSNSDLQEFI